MNDGNGGNNYAVTFVADTTGAITARAITVTATTDTKIYDGTVSAAAIPTVTTGTLAAGDTANFTETYDNKNVGTGKTLTATGSVSDGNGGNNYALTFIADTTGAITARAITVSATTNTKIYDGTISATAVPTVTGGTLASGDTGNFTETYDTKNVGTGKTLTATGSVNDGNGGNNYTVSFITDTTGVITARAITVTATSNTKIYDGTVSAAAIPTVTGGTLAAGDSGSFTETYDTKNIGSSKTLTATGSVNDGNGGNNYALTFIADASGTITARTITVSATTNTKIYDGTISAAAIPTVTGGTLAPGDSGNFTETYDTKNVGTGKTLTATGSVNDGNGGNNYTVSFIADTTGAITARAITVTATSNTKAYDGNNSAAAIPTITGGTLAAGDTVNLTEVYDTNNGGTGKTLTAFGSVNDGNGGHDYTVTFLTNTTGAITPIALRVTAIDASKVYGQANPAFAVTYSGFLNGETPSVLAGRLTYATIATAASSVGNYPVSPSGLRSSNYTIVFGDGSLHIAPAPLTITALDATKVYGDPNPAFGVTYNGFVNGDTPAVLLGNLTFATSAINTSGIGSYSITPGGVSAHNYSIRFAGGTLTVTPTVSVGQGPSGPTAPPTTVTTTRDSTSLSADSVSNTANKADVKNHRDLSHLRPTIRSPRVGRSFRASGSAGGRKRRRAGPFECEPPRERRAGLRLQHKQRPGAFGAG